MKGEKNFYFFLCVLFVCLLLSVGSCVPISTDFREFSYRRKITISNENVGQELLNEDVLIQVPLWEWKGSTKIQGDCLDLIVTNENADQFYDYWIENGCKEDEGKIWFTLSSLDYNDEITVQLFFGSKDKVITSNSFQKNFTEKFFLLSQVDCSEDWVNVNTNFHSKLMYGTDTVSHAMQEGGSAFHSHLIEGTTAPCSSSDIEVEFSSPGDLGSQHTHDHFYSIRSSVSSNYPPTVDVILCESNGFSRIPKKSIVVVKNATKGFEYMSELDNMFVKIGTEYGIRNEIVADRHNHSFQGYTHNNTDISGYKDGGKDDPFNYYDHSHFFSGVTTTVDSELPPYKKVVFVTNNETLGINRVEYENVYIIGSGVPPKGWTHVTGDLGGFFLMGGRIYGVEGGNKNHNHSYVGVDLSNSDTWDLSITGEDSIASVGHAHGGINGMSGIASSLPPYFSVLFLRRKSNVVSVTHGDDEILDISCFGVNFRDEKVCTSNGVCKEKNYCDCYKNYYGLKCEVTTCNGTFSNDSRVCSSNGRCKKYEKCSCKFLYTSKYCNKKTNFYKFLLYVESSWYWYLLGAVILCIVLSVCCVIVVLFSLYFKQKLKLRKFNALDVEIILNEEKAGVGTDAKLEIKPEMFVIKYEDISLTKELGKGGGNATVYESKWKDTKCAFKMFRTNYCLFTNQVELEEFEAEINLMASLSHPNIIRFYGASLSLNGRIGICYELCSNGDLAVYFYKTKKREGFFPLKDKVKILSGLACGMEHLHDRKIIHRDLKHFGLSKEKGEVKTKRIGTSLYMSPEVTLGKPYNEMVDVFAFAMIIAGLLKESFLLYGTTESFGIELRVAEDEKYRPVIEENLFPVWLINLMKDCWKKDPERRKGFSEIKEIINDNLDSLELEEKEVNELKNLDSLEEKEVNELKNLDSLELEEKEVNELKN